MTRRFWRAFAVFCGLAIAALMLLAAIAAARAARLQAVIIGMFPMWINAMSYCEHGHQSELLAMRNYYNGRANPMTNDDISLMFSVIPEKNEGGGDDDE